MPRHVVATLGEIADGGRKIVAINGREIGVFRLGEEFFAIYNWCPHEGAELCKGSLVSRCRSDRPGEYALERRGEMLRCPWHGWEYDIRTGQSWCDPASVKIKTYEVNVEAGKELVKGPYVAETVPVIVENSYVVLEIV